MKRLFNWLGITRSNTLFHSAVVGSIILLVVVLTIAQEDNYIQAFEDVLEFVLVLSLQVLIPVYLHFALWRFTLAKKKYFAYIIGLLVIVLGWPFVIGKSVANVMIGLGVSDYTQFASNTFFGIIFATGLRAIYRLFVRDQEVQKLQKQRVESELAALKAQLNPHFLFNTLNNIYGVNIDDPEQGSAMLLELADVMRYHYELSQRNSISLIKEVELIRSVVALESLRLRENTIIDLQLPSDDFLKGFEVPPLLLVPFVENAFKHGTHSTRPGDLVVRMRIAKNRLEFETSNPIFNDRQTVKTGVGITNVRQRLSLLYGDDRSLQTSAIDGRWRVKLSIPLTHNRLNHV